MNCPQCMLLLDYCGCSSEQVGEADGDFTGLVWGSITFTLSDVEEAVRRKPVESPQIEDPDDVARFRALGCSKYTACMNQAAAMGWTGFTCNYCQFAPLARALPDIDQLISPDHLNMRVRGQRRE